MEKIIAFVAVAIWGHTKDLELLLWRRWYINWKDFILMLATLNIKYFEISFANVVEQLWWKSLFLPNNTRPWWDLLRKLISIFMLGFFLESMHSIWIITMMSGSKSDSIQCCQLKILIILQILNSKLLTSKVSKH